MPARFRVPRADFKRMRGFKRLSSTLFSLSWGEIAGRSHPGAAVVVSKKVANRAATRNTIKRRARTVLLSTVRTQKSPLVFVVVAKKAAVGASYAAIRADIQNLMARALPSR